MLPFPTGYSHDLSLITGNDRISLVSPSESPPVIRWASYSSVLSGVNVYEMRPSLLTADSLEEGRTAANPPTSADLGSLRSVTVVGSEYQWDRKTLSTNASILWRTAQDNESSSADREKWSSAVLCIGNPTSGFSEAVVFENFEASFLSDIDPFTGKGKWAAVKGGYILPEEVRNARIVSNSSASDVQNQLQDDHDWASSVDAENGRFGDSEL